MAYMKQNKEIKEQMDENAALFDQCLAKERLLKELRGKLGEKEEMYQKERERCEQLRKANDKIIMERRELVKEIVRMKNEEEWKSLEQFPDVKCGAEGQGQVGARSGETTAPIEVLEARDGYGDDDTEEICQMVDEWYGGLGEDGPTPKSSSCSAVGAMSDADDRNMLATAHDQLASGKTCVDEELTSASRETDDNTTEEVNSQPDKGHTREQTEISELRKRVKNQKDCISKLRKETGKFNQSIN